MRRRLVLALVALAVLAVAFIPAAYADSQVPVFTVIGLVYEDQNGDGAYGLGLSGVEPGIANVTMSLYLDNVPLNVLGPEDKLLESQTTNHEGYVVFHNVPQGFYILRTHTVANFVASSPNMQALTLKGETRGAALEWTFGLMQRSQMPVRAFMPVVNR
jgi:hypothetical protein